MSLKWSHNSSLHNRSTIQHYFVHHVVEKANKSEKYGRRPTYVQRPVECRFDRVELHGTAQPITLRGDNRYRILDKSIGREVRELWVGFSRNAPLIRRSLVSNCCVEFHENLSNGLGDDRQKLFPRKAFLSLRKERLESEARVYQCRQCGHVSVRQLNT
jgi:hypothetical protein